MIMGSCSMNRLNGRNMYVHKLRMGRDTKMSEYCANKTFSVQLQIGFSKQIHVGHDCHDRGCCPERELHGRQQLGG